MKRKFSYVNAWSYPRNIALEGYKENSTNKDAYRIVFSSEHYNSKATLEEVERIAFEHLLKNQNEVLFINTKLYIVENNIIVQVNKEGE